MSYYNQSRGGHHPSQYNQPREIRPPRVINIQGDNEIDLIAQAHAGQPKKMKRTYIITDQLPPIAREIDIDAYRAFIIKLLMERGNIIRSEAETYTDKAAMLSFVRAMTHDSVSPSQRADNYEMTEHLGDATVNKCATWYLKSRFPEIISRGDPGVQIISKQKSLITSKPYLAKYSEFLGLTKFIRFRPLQFTYSKEGSEGVQSTQIKKIVLDRSMKEDVFEAWFGCLEDVIDTKEGMIGVGYSVCFKILSSLFDEQVIPFTKNDLVDAKTQLKEIIDRGGRSQGNKETYQVDREKGELSLVLHFETIPPGNEQAPFEVVMGPYSTNISGMEGDYETNKKIIEQQASRDMLKYLQKKYPESDRFVRYKPDE